MLDSQKQPTTVEDSGRFQNFIIFEPASIRVSPSDVLLQGEEVQTFFDDLFQKLMVEEQSIKEQILQNRLVKIGQMLELLQSYDNVIISKYFDRIWRRYAYISHLGESFLDLQTYLHYFPDASKALDDVVAQRFDLEDIAFDDEVDGDGDGDEDSGDDEDKAEKTESLDERLESEASDDEDEDKES